MRQSRVKELTLELTKRSFPRRIGMVGGIPGVDRR